MKNGEVRYRMKERVSSSIQWPAMSVVRAEVGKRKREMKQKK